MCVRIVTMRKLHIPFLAYCDPRHVDRDCILSLSNARIYGIYFVRALDLKQEKSYWRKSHFLTLLASKRVNRAKKSLVFAV